MASGPYSGRTWFPTGQIPLATQGLTRILTGRRVLRVENLCSVSLQGRAQTRQRRAQRLRTARVLSPHCWPWGDTPSGSARPDLGPIGTERTPGSHGMPMPLVPAGATWRACFYTAFLLGPEHHCPWLTRRELEGWQRGGDRNQFLP